MDLPRVYEPLEHTSVLVDKLKIFLEQYNEILRGANMDLVFFPDAIENIIKISRIIRNPGKFNLGNIYLKSIRSIFIQRHVIDKHKKLIFLLLFSYCALCPCVWSDSFGMKLYNHTGNKDI